MVPCQVAPDRHLSIMRWIRRLFVLFCLIATGLVIWAGVYARKQGFTQSWRNAIEREFGKRGYQVEIGKITLGAFRGLVAEDVTFFLDERRTEEIASLDDVYLDVDLSRIFQKQVSVNTLDVEDASLSLPLDPKDPRGHRLRVEDVSGRVVVTESMIEISRVEAKLGEFDIELKGSLLRELGEGDREDAEEKDESLEGMTRTQELLQGILEELEKYEFLDERPLLSIEFRGDLSDLATTTAKIRLETERFRRKGETYEISGLEARLSYDGLREAAKLEEFRLRDPNGELRLSGDWHQEANDFEFELQSSVDLTNLLGVYWKDRRLLEVVFFRPPSIEASGVVDFDLLGSEGAKGFPGEVLGQFQAERFVTRGSVFSGIDFGFSLAEDRVYLRNLRLDHKSGVAFLNLKVEPGGGMETIQFQTEVKLDPHAFLPFFDEGGRKFLNSWEFDDSSNVYVAFAGRGETWSMKTWESKGVIDLRNFELNGISFLEMETDFAGVREQLSFSNVVLAREEGAIRAESALHNTVDQTWEVEGVVSTVDIVEGAAAFSPKLGSALTKYRFDKPPTVRLAGSLDSRRKEDVGEEPRRNELTIEFESDGPARYTFLGETIVSDSSSGLIEVDRSRVHLKRLDASVFGGSLALEYDVRNVRSENRRYDATIRLQGVPLEALTSLYGDTDSLKGTIAGTVNLSGTSGVMNSINGHGAATVSDGNLFAIPLLGPLSKMVAKSRPGEVDLGANVAREASASLRIEDGIIYSDDFEALTDSFRVRAAGSVSLVDRSVDVEAVVNTKDALSSAVLTPVSELLTFSCTGTLDNQEWKAKHISNLGKVPAQMITELTNIPVEGLKKISEGLFGPEGMIGGGGLQRSAEERQGGGGASSPDSERRPGRPKLFQRLQKPGDSDREEGE